MQDRTVAATIDVQISSIFGRLSGLRQNLNFTPSSVTKHVSRKVEVALVVDITGSMCSPCTKIDDLKAAAKEMIDVLYSSFPEPGAIRVSLVPYSASVNVGATYLEDVAAYNDAIDTCVMEREGINTYTNAVPVNGSLFETTGNTPASDRPGYSCPDSEIVPLTDLTTVASRDAFKAKIDVLNPSGATAGHIGLAWGWYMLTPEWSSVWPGDSAPKPYREDVTKTLILMTDGMFNRSYWNNGHTLSDSERLDPLVPGSSGYQALQLCGAITDRVAAPFGPKLYTVSFMAPPEADALMQQCAGAGNAYTAENRASLTAAFTEIVNRLTSLAVTN